MINSSNTEKLVYALCFIVGFALIFLIAFLVRRIRTNNGKSMEYDERQKAIQGVAYKYSFFTVVAYFLANGFYCYLFGDWLDSMAMNFIGICLGVVVFSGYSIVKDAYIAMSSNLSKYAGLFFLVSLFSFAGYFGNMYLGDGDNSMTMNLICGITFLIITIVSLIKMAMDKKAEKEID